MPFSSSMNLGLGNLGNLGNLGLGGLGGLGLNKGKADSVFGPVNFKFLGEAATPCLGGMGASWPQIGELR